MKCRTLGIRLEQPFAAIDEAAATEFMESVKVRKVTAAMCDSPQAWSVLVFFDAAERAGDPVGHHAGPCAVVSSHQRSRRRKTQPETSAPPDGSSSGASGTRAARTAGMQHEACPRDPDGSSLTPVEQRMVESIKEWRREQAFKVGLPPYCVVQNGTIEQIARTRPMTLDELAGIKGLGPSRLDKYGPELLALVRRNGNKP